MSNFDENKINRQCAGTSTGGQFANKDHPSNDGVRLGSSGLDLEALVERAEAQSETVLQARQGLNRMEFKLGAGLLAAKVRQDLPSAQTIEINRLHYVDSPYGNYVVQSVEVRDADGNSLLDSYGNREWVEEEVGINFSLGDSFSLASDDQDTLTLDIDKSISGIDDDSIPVSYPALTAGEASAVKNMVRSGSDSLEERAWGLESEEYTDEDREAIATELGAAARALQKM